MTFVQTMQITIEIVEREKFKYLLRLAILNPVF